MFPNIPPSLDGHERILEGVGGRALVFRPRRLIVGDHVPWRLAVYAQASGHCFLYLWRLLLRSRVPHVVPFVESRSLFRCSARCLEG